MSKYIKVETVEDILYDYTGGYDYLNSMRTLEEQQTVDIVRCKDCKHNLDTTVNNGKNHPRCVFTEFVLTENDFCSKGEKR